MQIALVLLNLTLSITIIIAGWQLSSFIPLCWHRTERLAIASFLGVFFSSWLVLILSLLFGFYVATCSYVIVVLLFCGVTFRFPQPVTYIAEKFTLYTAIRLILHIGLWYLFFTHILPSDATGNLMSVGATWGDIALHTSLITSLSRDVFPSLQFSLLDGYKLTYPFLIDFFSAWLHFLGNTLTQSILFPSLILGSSLLELIYFFGLRLFKKAEVSILAMVLFLFGGAPIALFIALQAWQKSGESLFVFLKHLPQDFGNWADKSVHVTNILTTMLLPQRGLLFGLSAVLVLLIYLHGYSSKSTNNSINDSQHNKAGQWLIIALIGLLPLAHVHSFLFAYLFLLLYAVFFKVHRLNILILLLGISLLALSQMIWQLKAIHTKSFISLYIGWLKSQNQNIFAFWIQNFGILPLLLLTVSLFAKKQWYRFFALSALLFFAIGNTLKLQPFLWDNMKLFFFSLLIGAYLSAYYLQLIWNKNIYGKIFVPLIVFLLVSPGCLSLLKEQQSQYMLFDKSSQEVAHWTKIHTSSKAKFIIYPVHNHPISALAGRNILVGYNGWLWSYGLPYADRTNYIRQVLRGEINIAETGYDYLVVGTPEKAVAGIKTPHLPIVFINKDWSIYAIEPKSIH